MGIPVSRMVPVLLHHFPGHPLGKKFLVGLTNSFFGEDTRRSFAMI